MGSRMNKRFFRCHCGHKVRFLSSRCGMCWEPTPLLNRRGFWRFMGLMVLAAPLVLLAMLLI